MKFETPIWHTNISPKTGFVCLDILDAQWSPALTIRTVLLSIQGLLCEPEPEDPLNLQAAEEYKRDRAEYESHARQWVVKYALPETKQLVLDRLEAAGFTKEQCTKAMAKCGHDEDRALEELLKQRR